MPGTALRADVINRSCVDDDTKGIGNKMKSATEKINEMVDNVLEEGGETVLLEDKPEVEVKAEPVSAEAGTMDLIATEKKEDKPAEETAEKLDPSFLMPEKTAHISEVIKQRKRAQRAEAENAELKATIQGQQSSDELAPDISNVLENPDDLVDGNTVAKLIKQGVDQGIKNYQDTVNAQQTATKAAEVAAEQKIKLDKSFVSASEKFKDFNQVTTMAAKQQIFTDLEKADILSSQNPYEMLYAKSIERLKILGQKPASGTKQIETKVNNDLLSPDKEATEEQETDIGIYEALNG